MASVDNDGSRERFAAAFRDSLRAYADTTGTSQVEIAKRLGVSKSRVNQYLSDSPPSPDSRILFLACANLRGFRFEYDGRELNAKTIRKKAGASPEQMTFRFNRQFNLTNKNGLVTEQGAFAVKVKRPSGGLELSLLLKGRKAS